MSRPEKLARALGRALRDIDMDQRLKESRAMALWPEVVGEMTASRARPLHVNRGTMVVVVASSAWANELNMLKTRFLDGLAARVGPGVIVDLKWRVGDPAAPDDAGSPTEHAATRRRRDADPPPRLEPAEQAAIDREVAEIEDPRLAARLSAVLAGQARRRKRLREQGWIACTSCGVLHEAGDPLCPPCRLRADGLLDG